jgi:hypothetical protein
MHAWLPGTQQPLVKFADTSWTGLGLQLLAWEFPGWQAWVGVGGLVYAKHPNGINPPVVLRAAGVPALRKEIVAYLNGK